MPRILQINTCINKSTGRITQQIGEKAISQGWDSFIAYSARETEFQSKSKLYRIGSKWGSYIHAFIARIFDNQGLLSYFATRKFIKEIKQLNPDIIHLHNIHGYYLNYPLLFKFLSSYKKPVVWTLHDCWPFTGHCVHYTDINCFKWKTQCQNCPKKISYPTSYVFDRSKVNYRKKKESFNSVINLTIVPVSYWLGNVVKQSILGEKPICVIQNGIDINSFYPRIDKIDIVKRKYNLIGKYVILGVAVGWSEDVGLSDFIKLRCELSDRFAIVMVGVTPEVKAKLPDNIVSIPRTNCIDELAELYSSADILFNGSFQETFGLVTAEAISCGTPVIVYNSTACPEIVTKDTGYIADQKDINKVISYIIKDSALSETYCKKRSKLCREFAVSHFDKESKYLEYIDLYNSLLKK